MSIILGALGGAGEALGKIGAENQRSANKIEEERASSDMAQQRAMALERFKNDLAVKTTDQQREAQVSRINTAAGGIADKAVADKRSIIQSAVADPESWTSEQQAAVDQSLALDKAATVADPKTRTQAAISTGDIDPKTAAGLGVKDDALLYKALWEQQKEDGRNSRADARIVAQQEASDKRLAYLFASLEKRGSKGEDTTKAALSFIDGARKEIASEAQTLRATYAAELKDKSTAQQTKIKDEYAPKFAAIETKRTQIDADFDNLREKVGLPSAAAKPAATPAPAAAAKPGAARPPLASFDRK